MSATHATYCTDVLLFWILFHQWKSQSQMLIEERISTICNTNYLKYTLTFANTPANKVRGYEVILKWLKGDVKMKNE